MSDILLALLRSITSLTQPRVWACLLAPAALSFCLWLGLAIWGLQSLVQRLLDLPPMTQLAGWGALWLAHLLAYLGGWMVIFALAYLTATLLAAIVVMPWLLRLIQSRHYPELAALGADSFAAATANSVWAAVVFVAGWLASIPLWLIPGGALVLPLLLMAWYNRRTFAYDALSQHATPEEWRRIRQEKSGSLFMLGALMAVLAHVPVLGLLVPGLAALAYIHFGLEALRRERGGAVLSGEARRIDEPPAGYLNGEQQ